MKLAIAPLALLAMLTLAACGGGSDATSPGAGNGGGGDTPVAVAPVITMHPVDTSVTAPATATFSVTASGTAPLTYQWRSSSNGTDWTNLGGATSASYQTNATSADMNGRYYSVVVGNGAGSVASSSAKLTVQTTAGPSGEFPHTANPLAIAVTEADTWLTNFDNVSSTDRQLQVPPGAAGIGVDSGVSVSIALAGTTFLEDQTLAVVPVALAGVGVAHPLPFQSVLGAFNLRPANPDLPELQANDRIRITFTLTQQALDALGGQPVIFSARPDGTQLHLVPVFVNDNGMYSALVLGTSVAHLGIFGIATVSSTQAATLAAAWPSYGDFQLEAAVAPPSYQLRSARLVSQASAPDLRMHALSRSYSMSALAADDDWAAQMQARIDAYYNDQVVPAVEAANAANADLAQFHAAVDQILAWERMRQLLGLQDERDAHARDDLVNFTQRAIDKGLQDCSANRNVAAAAQLLGLVRQAQLLGVDTDVTAQSVLETCANSTFDLTVTWNQTHTDDHDLKYDDNPDSAYTGRWQSTATIGGKLHSTGLEADLPAVSFDLSLSYALQCADGAYRCTPVKYTQSVHDPATQVTKCGGTVYASFRVDRWNLDARGHYAAPYLYITFQVPFGCTGGGISVFSPATEIDYDANGNTTSRTVNSGDMIDVASWSGGANLGTSSRIVRRTKPITGPGVVPGSFERWSTSLAFKIDEVLPAH